MSGKPAGHGSYIRALVGPTTWSLYGTPSIRQMALPSRIILASASLRSVCLQPRRLKTTREYALFVGLPQPVEGHLGCLYQVLALLLLASFPVRAFRFGDLLSTGRTSGGCHIVHEVAHLCMSCPSAKWSWAPQQEANPKNAGGQRERGSSSTVPIMPQCTPGTWLEVFA